VQVVFHGAQDGGRGVRPTRAGVHTLLCDDGGHVSKHGLALAPALLARHLELPFFEDDFGDFHWVVTSERSFHVLGFCKLALADVEEDEFRLQHLPEVCFDPLAPAEHLVVVASDFVALLVPCEPHDTDICEPSLVNRSPDP